MLLSEDTKKPKRKIKLEWRETALRVFSIGLCVASLIAALHPTIRGFIRSKLIKEYRQVLSITSGAIEAGKNYKVIKIKTSKGLFLEVYGDSKSQIQPLVDRIKLPDKKDGYFIFNGQATNLVLKDIDGDNQMEIIVPSFDNNLVAHLNVYKYDQQSKRFFLIKQ